ncbi:hypothetical protein ACWEFL_15195 [Streptomyces sp. NPDC004838]
MDMQVWRDTRSEAVAAAEAMRTAMAALGIPERVWRLVEARVTRGRAYVQLGMVRADAVELMADILLRATAAPQAPLSGRVEMRWLDTGSGPGAMVPVLIPDTDDTSG